MKLAQGQTATCCSSRDVSERSILEKTHSSEVYVCGVKR